MQAVHIALHVELQVILRRLPLERATPSQGSVSACYHCVERGEAYVAESVPDGALGLHLRCETAWTILERVVQPESVGCILDGSGLGRCSSRYEAEGWVL